jgi:hypothetical protein
MDGQDVGLDVDGGDATIYPGAHNQLQELNDLHTEWPTTGTVYED